MRPYTSTMYMGRYLFFSTSNTDKKALFFHGPCLALEHPTAPHYQPLPPGLSALVPLLLGYNDINTASSRGTSRPLPKFTMERAFGSSRSLLGTALGSIQ